MTIIKTKIIVLSKMSYQESSLIISTISPDSGKVDFIVKGAKRISRKSLPVVDLFREFSVEFRDKNNTKLQTAMAMDLLTGFDNVALYPSKILDISDIVCFLLKNEHPGIPCPLVYQSFRNVLAQCAAGRGFQTFLVKLVYLFENGLLPQNISETDDKESERVLNILIDYSLGKGLLSSLDGGYSEKLKKWVEHLCRLNGLE